MRLLSVLTFPAAANRGHARAFMNRQPRFAQRKHPSERFELMNVIVDSKAALFVRRALLDCAGTAIVRCLPLHHDGRVKLEVHFPAGHGEEVMQHVLKSVPTGEFGCIIGCAPPASHSTLSLESLHGQ